MIVPRHKICDICGIEVGVNNRYYKIKSNDYVTSYAGCISSKMTHHICHSCMEAFQIWLKDSIEIDKEDAGCYL